jgi:hypothetical protein
MITDSWMKSSATKSDIWKSENAPRGAGRFIARLTSSGERLFYFRYTDAHGKQVRMPIGSYDKSGSDGLTVAEARAKAGELSRLYQTGVRDVRAHEQARIRAEEAQRLGHVTRSKTRGRLRAAFFISGLGLS